MTLVEIVFMLFALFCASTGALAGLTLSERANAGALGSVIASLVGFVAGAIAAVLLELLAAVIYTPFECFGRWWRPYPPACETGTCRGWRDYDTVRIPDHIFIATKGISWLGHCCKCGNLYAGGYGHGYQNRWLRILPDGTIRLYLKHGFLGRWIPDDGVGIGEGRIERVSAWCDRDNIPGWIVPVLSAATFGGISLLVVYLESGFANPIAGWFVLACATLALLVGCVVWWLGSPSKSNEQ